MHRAKFRFCCFAMSSRIAFRLRDLHCRRRGRGLRPARCSFGFSPLIFHVEEPFSRPGQSTPGPIKKHAHTNRFPPAHPQREKHAANHPRHEIHSRRPPAQSPRRRSRRPPLRPRNPPRPTQRRGPHGRSRHASVTRAPPGTKNPSRATHRRPRPSRPLQRQRNPLRPNISYANIPR